MVDYNQSYHGNAGGASAKTQAQANMYKQQADMYKAKMAANPRPEDFEHVSPLDQETWQLDPALHMDNAGAWETSMLDKQKLEQQQMMQNIKDQTATGLAGAQNRLAMRGGMSSGAKERIGAQGQENLMNANTQVGLAGAQSRAQIGNQAQNIGMQEQQFNIQNVLGQNQYSNQAALDKYKTQMQGWAGKEYADAQRAAGADSGGK